MKILGDNIRKDFPIFNKFTKRLSFLDSAASTQKPAYVIKKLSDFYLEEYSNIQRGAYDLSANATKSYEDARKKIAKFINVKNEKSIIFTRGTTEGINLLAYTLADYVKNDDVILLSIAEHHSNLVPWQNLARKSNVKLEFVELDKNYNLDIDDYQKKMEKYQPKIVSLTMLSNVLGSVSPVKKIIEIAKRYNSITVLDAAQYVSHLKIDIEDLNPDFLCFSGHKIYGPTGIGVLYGNYKYLNQMNPFQFGGEMIEHVEKMHATYAESPQKFEAGTPAIAEAIALGSAIDFVEDIGIENIYEHEKNIFLYAFNSLSKVDGIKIYSDGNIENKASVLSFNIEGIHPHDFASIADSFGVQIRSGFHCAMPLLQSLKVDSTCRISLGMYSDKEDIDALVDAIKRAKKIFGK